MNRVVVSDAVWEALAECDLLGRVLNEHSVALLRHHLLTIRHEVTRARVEVLTGEQACGIVTREEAGTLATSGPSEDITVTTGDASMRTVPNPSTPVKSSRE